MCERWQLFSNFWEDMGPRPSARHSINRIDNDGNYEPGNCEWATPQEQVWNRNKTDRNTSGYIGVSWNKNVSKWSAQIRDNFYSGNFIIGYYDDIEEAALAYDVANIFFRGDRGVTNILHL